MSTEGQGTKEYFWLKTVPKRGEDDHQGKEKENEQFSNLFVRLIGSGSDSVVLTEQPPKFLRSHINHNQSKGEIVFTSSSPQHQGRQWHFNLLEKAPKGIDLTKQNRPQWCPVSIKEVFEGQEGEKDGDQFEFKSLEGEQEGKVLYSTNPDFQGFVICQWTFGHPQLFWLTESFKGDLPFFMEKVDLIWSPYTAIV